MDRQLIAKARLGDWITALQQAATVYGPRERDGLTRYVPLGPDDRPLLEFGNSDWSPKEVFFPLTEEVLRWRRGPQGMAVEEPPSPDPIVVFALRPCDTTATVFMDQAYDLGGLRDPYYWRRREGAGIIALCCVHPCPECYGPSVGVDEASPAGADVVLTDLGEELVAEVKTDKGRELVELGEACFRPAGEAQVQRAGEAIAGLLKELAAQSLDLASPTLRARALLESAAWEQIWRRCTSCGICAFVCPACHCFDLVDQPARGGGCRVRCYDSCCNPIYSKLAGPVGGHNPRPTPQERLRQRLLHKFDYIPSRFGGLLGCVGCGRCRRCPVDIDLQAAMAQVGLPKGGAA